MRAALSFLTVLPVGARGAAPGRGALLWFPVAGLVLGLGWAAVGYTGAALWTPLVGAALLVAFDLAATGALHADAVADVTDGVASRRPPLEALQVMREPAVGAVGAAAACAALLVRLAFAATMIGAGLWALLVAAPALSRAAMVLVLAVGQRPDEPSLAAELSRAASGPVAATALGLAAAVTALAGALEAGAPGAGLGLAATATVGAVTLACEQGWRRRFGPLTGDAAGATGTAAELTALAVLALAAERLG